MVGPTVAVGNRQNRSLPIENLIARKIHSPTLSKSVNLLSNQFRHLNSTLENGNQIGGVSNYEPWALTNSNGRQSLFRDAENRQEKATSEA